MKSILVVDDHEDSAEMAAAVLRSFGHIAVYATGPMQALKLIESIQFDLIITDLRMPDMDGREFLRQLRKNGVTVPVVALTGDPSAFNSGADGFAEVWLKPVCFRDMREAVPRLTAKAF